MDDAFIGILTLAALAIFFAPLILSIVALSRSGDLRRRIAKLEARLAQGETPAAAAVAPEPQTGPEPATAAQPGRVWAEASRGAEPQVAEPVAAAEPGATPGEQPETVGPAEQPADLAAAAPPSEPQPPVPPPPPRAGIEERLTSRWLVWVGAIALVLAGIFLIKYSIDNALLTPAMRATFGLILGVALTAAGEWLRRRPMQKEIAAIKPDYVPGALTSAGLFICFASIYAAYALLDLLSPTIAFIGLAAVALVAFALAALHSPIVAIIGLLAGFATPALISSSEPNSGIFAYLALIATAAYAVVIYRGWGWLAYGATIGGLLWTLIWIIGPMQAKDLLIIAAFLAVLTAAAIWLALRLTPEEAPVIWQKPHTPQGPEFNGWLAAIGSVVLAALAASSANAPMVSLALAAAGAVVLSTSGRRFERFDGFVALAAALLLLVLLAWDPDGILGQLQYDIDAGNIIAPAGALFAPEAKSFVLSHLFGGALIAALGFFLLRGSQRPHIWAGVSLLGALLILAAAYARSRFFTTDLLWAITATLSAAITVSLAGSLNKRREERPYRLALGFYAAAAIAGVSFAFAFVFREAWLTVALALQLPALAWLEKTLDLKELRKLALCVAAVILVRLALNPYVLSYETNHALGTQWILYGYGVPALAFFAAGFLFKQRFNDLTVTVMESGAFVFALLLVALEIRIFTEGRIAAEELTLFELSLHTLVWLGAGWWRLKSYVAASRAIDKWWAIILIGLGLLSAFLGQFLILNPLFSYDSIGDRPIFNALIVAYLAPAILIGLIANTLPPIARAPHARIVLFAGALLLILTWVTLETKRFFQGPILSFSAASDGEWYAYSVVWLVSSLVLLAVGLWRQAPWLRHGALAILILTVCKVFLSDMGALGGLYRVFSFLGLGLFLVGIGYIYQRYVFTGKKPQDAAPQA